MKHAHTRIAREQQMLNENELKSCLRLRRSCKMP